ncbi:hypothetical protein GYMLUDRAFT_60668 [Collybiopsis luxurians FD-317 M1]|uniref:Histone-lysine N-methyltransferase, H3 lysine-79 specific n=1 Tax=Collybiopsis luxurians FD-317 M1 TaxID=944289 RepID=A0A0D0BTD2_9AGAR|nr:hypothetical protein GYMLUDRAFT_60668 [Collybiopsis luxurians FD-317 M1]
MYGKFNPCFLQRIFEEAELTSASYIVDMGSGVGDVVVQASLYAGCSAFGIELHPDLMKLAEGLLSHIQQLGQLSSIPIGGMEIIQRNMLTDATAKYHIEHADLIVCNNQCLDAQGKKSATVKNFDPCQEGCDYSISEDTFYFLSPKWRAWVADLFSTKKQVFQSGDVSWSNNGKDYYWQVKK